MPKTDHVSILGLFSESECFSLVEEFGVNEPHERSEYRNRKGNVIRDTDVRWLYENRSTSYIFERVRSAVQQCNDRWFGFELRLEELIGIQFASYSAGQHYSWHTDLGTGRTSRRKLTISVQISQADEYEGGNLEIFRSFENLATAPKEPGSGIVFPSYVSHRVTPVSRGARHSLTAWIEGPPFR